MITAHETETALPERVRNANGAATSTGQQFSPEIPRPWAAPHAEQLPEPTRVDQAGSVATALDVPPEPGVANVVKWKLARRPQLGPMPAVQMLEHWEGQVEAVRDGTVHARMRSLRDSAAEEHAAEIELDAFVESERASLQAGDTFYWAVGYRTEHGTRTGFSEVKLRRLPAWTEKDVERVARSARRWDALFDDAG